MEAYTEIDFIIPESEKVRVEVNSLRNAIIGTKTKLGDIEQLMKDLH